MDLYGLRHEFPYPLSDDNIPWIEGEILFPGDEALVVIVDSVQTHRCSDHGKNYVKNRRDMLIVKERGRIKRPGNLFQGFNEDLGFSLFQSRILNSQGNKDSWPRLFSSKKCSYLVRSFLITKASASLLSQSSPVSAHHSLDGKGHNKLF